MCLKTNFICVNVSENTNSVFVLVLGSDAGCILVEYSWALVWKHCCLGNPVTVLLVFVLWMYLIFQTYLFIYFFYYTFTQTYTHELMKRLCTTFLAASRVEQSSKPLLLPAKLDLDLPTT